MIYLTVFSVMINTEEGCCSTEGTFGTTLGTFYYSEGHAGRCIPRKSFWVSYLKNKADFFYYGENNLKEEGFTLAHSFGGHMLQLADSGVAGSVIRWQKTMAERHGIVELLPSRQSGSRTNQTRLGARNNIRGIPLRPTSFSWT